MKSLKKYLAAVLLITGLTIWFSSCSKDEFTKTYEGFHGKVYMSQAAEGRHVLNLPLSSKPVTIGFGASFGGATYPAKSDIPVKFALLNEWISEYNRENGTTYEPLPEDAFSISGFNSVIKAGNTTSDSLVIRIESKKLDLEKKYMFPITLISAGDKFIDEELQTTWFRIDTIVRSERDVTSQGTLAVRKDNNGGPDDREGSKKLVDNSIDTKFLISAAHEVLPDFWYQLTFPNPIVLGAYTMTSANDAQDRDPKSWRLLGSNDGTTWDVLDNQPNQVFSARKFTIRYEFPNETPYKIYRISISELYNSTNLFQQAEWRVIEFYEQ